MKQAKNEWNKPKANETSQERMKQAKSERNKPRANETSQERMKQAKSEWNKPKADVVGDKREIITCCTLIKIKFTAMPEIFLKSTRKQLKNVKFGTISTYIVFEKG